MTRSSWLSLSGNPRHAIVFTTLSHLPAWWQTVDGNPSWQSGVFFGLAGAYGIIGLVAVVQLIRIQLRVPEYGWTTQKMFHLLNFIVCVLRMSVFVLREPIASLKPVALQSVLLDLPGLLFTTTYTLLVLFWAEIYHQAKTLPTGNLRPTFIAFNLLVYAIQVGIWCFIAGSEKGSNLRIARSLSAGFMGESPKPSLSSCLRSRKQSPPPPLLLSPLSLSLPSLQRLCGSQPARSTWGSRWGCRLGTGVVGLLS